VIVASVVPPFDNLSIIDFLSIYDRTVRWMQDRGKNTRKYVKFRAFMHYYGNHPTSPIKVSYNYGIFDMAKQKYDIEFIELPLTAQDEPEIEKFVQEYHGDLENLITDVCAGKYKFSIGFYEEQESYAAYIQPIGDDHKNTGKMLSAWSDNPAEALFLVAFKHKVKFESGVWKKTGKKGRWG